MVRYSTLTMTMPEMEKPNDMKFIVAWYSCKCDSVITWSSNTRGVILAVLRDEIHARGSGKQRCTKRKDNRQLLDVRRCMIYEKKKVRDDKTSAFKI